MQAIKEPVFIIVDLFCGFGGTTTGFHLAAISDRRIAQVIACINHDPKAIKSHWLNNPDVVHFEEDIRTLDLTAPTELVMRYRQLYPNAKLILWASLECTNFSKAKGGLPRDADSRTLADHLPRYIHALQPDYIQIENVVEFMSWGPLDAKGKPISRKSGSDWLRWRRDICLLGYRDEWRELNSADFGAYTSRNRLFGVFAKAELPIAWPHPTHSKKPSKSGLHGDLQKWKAVKDVLNFEDEGESIFGRKKPLSDNTLERIWAGLIKYIAKGDTSFLSKYFSGYPDDKNIPVDGPASSVTTKDHHSLIQASFLSKYYSGEPASKNSSIEEPAATIKTKDTMSLIQASFLTKNFSGKPEGKNISIEGPAGTLTTFGGSHALVQPEFLIKYNSKSKEGRYNPPSINEPSPVISTQNRLYLAQPEFIANYYSGGGQTTSVDQPCPTVTGVDGKALIQPEFLTIHNGKSTVRSVGEPCPTIATGDRFGLVQPEPFIDKHFGKAQNQSVDQPAGTIMPNDKHRLVTAEPFLMPTAYKNTPKSIEDPAPTLTASRRHHYLINPSWGGHPGSIDEPCCVIVARQDKAPLSFVQVEQGQVSIAIYDEDSPVAVRIKQFMVAYSLVDIKMRMLRVAELLKIQGFPSDYKMVGNQSDQKKFIGNSVVPHVVRAWTEAMGMKLDEYQQKVA